VPYGYKDAPIFPSRAQLLAASRALKRASLLDFSYQQTLARLKGQAFVYLDPPYPPLNGTAFFTHYTKDRFGDSDQTTLAKTIKKLDKKGVQFLMSNADTPLIRELYASFDIVSLNVTRYVTCKTARHRVGELVIRNY
jgi:DNA adenine methylase